MSYKKEIKSDLMACIAESGGYNALASCGVRKSVVDSILTLAIDYITPKAYLAGYHEGQKMMLKAIDESNVVLNNLGKDK